MTGDSRFSAPSRVARSTSPPPARSSRPSTSRAMTDPLDTLLGLVASGRLTAEEAAPLIDALQGPATRAESGSDGADSDAGTRTDGRQTADSSAGGGPAEAPPLRTTHKQQRGGDAPG